MNTEILKHWKSFWTYCVRMWVWTRKKKVSKLKPKTASEHANKDAKILMLDWKTLCLRMGYLVFQMTSLVTSMSEVVFVLRSDLDVAGVLETWWRGLVLLARFLITFCRLLNQTLYGMLLWRIPLCTFQCGFSKGCNWFWMLNKVLVELQIYINYYKKGINYEKINN